jgi:hypothetical protein
MNPLKDPRLPIFADAAPSGGYNGMPYGLDANAAASLQTSDYSFLGLHTRTQNAPCYIITYAQVLLAIAEADKLGFQRFFLSKYNMKGINISKYQIQIIPIGKIEEMLKVLFV